ETSAAARSVFWMLLDRRTRHRTIRAEHATVAGLWLQARTTPFAVIEELASVRGHRLRCSMAALRTGDGGLEFSHSGHQSRGEGGNTAPLPTHTYGPRGACFKTRPRPYNRRAAEIKDGGWP